MITSLELENFKGFGARQHIDFAPLTLLFGANNAGKSTILQALLYLHELLEHGDADVDRTELGGSVIELGGFARLVHQHDLNRTMKIRVNFDTPKDLERFGRDLTYFPFPDLSDDVVSVWLELEILQRNVQTVQSDESVVHVIPFLDRVSIGINHSSEPLVELCYLLSVGDQHLVEALVRLDHEVITDQAFQVAEAWSEVSYRQPDNGGESLAVDDDNARSGDAVSHTVDGARDARDSKEGLRFWLNGTRRSSLPHYNSAVHLTETEGENDELQFRRLQIQTFLEMTIAGTTAQLAAELRDAVYIGPLRVVPPRGFLYERVGRRSSWADGLAAWDQLLSDRLSLVEQTNAWLKRLAAGCEIKVQPLIDPAASEMAIAVEHPDAFTRRLLLRDTASGAFVLPQEVGAGISQVAPVIVAAVGEGAGIAMVEQPELHVHPKLQVGLGDLFIEACTKRHGRANRRRMMIVETHSEHLILRILRRIRETTEGELGPKDPPFSNNSLSVVYVEKRPDGVRISTLRVDKHGEFVDRWPKGFFRERAEELF